MHYRIVVNVISEFGNAREITTICNNRAEMLARKARYEERYPNGDIAVEEVREFDNEDMEVPPVEPVTE